MAQHKRVGDFDTSLCLEEAAVEARQERWRKSEMDAHSNEVWNYLNYRGSQAFPGGTSL